jgi:hypothetical protein
MTGFDCSDEREEEALLLFFFVQCDRQRRWIGRRGTVSTRRDARRYMHGCVSVVVDDGRREWRWLARVRPATDGVTVPKRARPMGRLWGSGRSLKLRHRGR